MVKFLIFSFLFLGLTSAKELPANHFFGLIHCHSIFSSGKNNFRQLHDLAVKHDIRFILMTENLNLRWEYGLPFLRNLVKKEVSMPSAMMFGFNNYLDEIKRWNKKQEEILFIPGVEVAPFYYWEEHLAEQYIKMWNYQKNLLFIGPDSAEIYEKIPASSNKQSYFYTKNSLLYLIPVFILLIFSIFLFKIKMVKLSVSFFIISIVTTINIYPFKQESVPIYEGDLKETPYQNFINYGIKNGAIIIWTSPEAKDYSEHDYKIGKVIIQTHPHPELLQLTKNYTAFAAIYEDNITATEPGNIWDQLLMDYLNGNRQNPIFGIGDALYHYEGQAGKYFKNIINGFWIDKVEKATIMNAIKDGRFYGYRNNENYRLKLEKFYATAGKNFAISGETLVIGQNSFDFKFDIKTEGIKEKEITINVIKNGELIRTITKNVPGEISIKEEKSEINSPAFYRFRIDISKTDYILTNPIFIKR